MRQPIRKQRAKGSLDLLRLVRLLLLCKNVNICYAVRTKYDFFDCLKKIAALDGPKMEADRESLLAADATCAG